ncbi:DNA polymerase III, delta prime subunit [Bartonella clarridgeiae 73]|uniref:DNA polymerase III, delta prime subunit n=1 Tax=Bartonella clarridgeiae (strain CCUG 45776 / CIP 104772 / 73) TaxID=696125 RepID=E6YHV4_BARC7|nr:DNA polymerase III subunit delta' [Bartonella clarridgeiae]WCR54986.1 MAG: DNA polymerase III delta prime subunit [Bartonella clarridgeiae]CBI76442.1 DNA polymerase III, delta prime subunit [Bartonella clarridgeiae 73]
MNDVNFLRQYDDIDGILSPSQNNILIGHEKVRHFLAQMLRKGRLHHALLFEGERGIGKATLAFHFAWNILNSQKNEFLQPKQDSVIWRQIKQGSHPSIIHVSHRFDAKTKKFKTGITVDDIRDIKHFLNQTSQDEWRIVIIDSADNMNRNAANAILKTLEEPPTKTLFIVISHSLGKLLPTIRSRCQKISLRPLNDDEMKKAISHVFSDQILTDQQNIETIIQKSQGSLRKAALLLCHGGLEIVQTINKLLEQSICNPVIVHNFAQSLSSSDSDIQFQQFCDEILDRIQKRAIMLIEKRAFALSKKYAQIWQNIFQEIIEVQSFNLDKKQFIINLLFKTHKIVHENKLFP